MLKALETLPLRIERRPAAPAIRWPIGSLAQEQADEG